MLKIDFMSTLFVGIDVSFKSNIVYAMDFHRNKYISSAFSNNKPGAEKLAAIIRGHQRKHPDLTTAVAALESSSVSIHIANFLSTCEALMPHIPWVFCLNPKMTASYRKSFIGMSKTNSLDAFIISDFARAGHIECEPSICL